MSTRFRTFSMKNGFHAVRAAIFSAGYPRRRASATAYIRLSVGSRSSSRRSSSAHGSGSSPAFPTSRDRRAFMKDSSIVRPIAITSPVDFIDVPMRASTVGNLSKGHRGIFVTT